MIVLPFTHADLNLPAADSLLPDAAKADYAAAFENRLKALRQ